LARTDTLRIVVSATIPVPYLKNIGNIAKWTDATIPKINSISYSKSHTLLKVSRQEKDETVILAILS